MQNYYAMTVKIRQWYGGEILAHTKVNQVLRALAEAEIIGDYSIKKLTQRGRLLRERVDVNIVVEADSDVIVKQVLEVTLGAQVSVNLSIISRVELTSVSVAA